MAKQEIIVLDIDEQGNVGSNLKGAAKATYDIISGRDGDNHDVVYMYKGPKDYYVGQTKHFEQRNKEHYSNDQPFKDGLFDKVAVVYGQAVKGNLDALEYLLIADVEKDNQHFSESVPLKERRGALEELVNNPEKLVKWNKTGGNTSDNLQQVASEIEPAVWRLLADNGFVHNPDLAEVKQGDLLVGPGGSSPSKYEHQVVDEVLADLGHNHVVQGYAGTGKTFVIDLLASALSRAPYNKSVAIAVKDNVVKKSQDKYKTWASPVTVDSYSSISCGSTHYDVVIVDEAHRLRRPYSKTKFLRKKLWNALEATGLSNELELIKTKGDTIVLMYDPLQTLRPDDITPNEFKEATQGWSVSKLSHQVRINPKGAVDPELGDEYVAGIADFLQYPEDAKPGIGYDKAIFTKYKDPENPGTPYFGVCDSIGELFDYLDHMENLHPHSANRVVAGYVRPWESHGVKDGSVYDWTETEGDGTTRQWRWNSTFEGWVNPVRAKVEDQQRLEEQYRGEIGSVHAVQGVDLNYVGVIIGKDLGIDANGDLIGVKDNYYDANGIPSSKDFDPDTFTRFIKNNYFMLLTRGISGVRVYFEDPAMRERFEKFMES